MEKEVRKCDRRKVELVEEKAIPACVRSNDFLICKLTFVYPDWFDELSDEEFENVLASARDNACQAFVKKLYEAEGFWRARKMNSMLGQMSIYDA